jgi:hypothetical protein
MIRGTFVGYVFICLFVPGDNQDVICFGDMNVSSVC